MMHDAYNAIINRSMHFVSNLAWQFKETVLTTHNIDIQVKLGWLIQETKKGS
jgi:hypothetical protein